MASNKNNKKAEKQAEKVNAKVKTVQESLANATKKEAEKQKLIYTAMAGMQVVRN